MFIANLALVASGRSAHVAILVAGGFCAIFLAKTRWRWWAAAAVLLFGVAILASSSMVRDRFTEGFEEIGTAASVKVETPIGSRIVIWKITGDLIESRPLLGYGTGGFAAAYAQRIQEDRNFGWRAEVKDP